MRTGYVAETSPVWGSVHDRLAMSQPLMELTENKSDPKIRSVYMTCFHIAHSLCRILGALSYI
jgi:hypothetical protein